MPAKRKHRKSNSKSSARKDTRPKSAAGGGLLVIECNAAKLATQDLAPGQSICDLFRTLHPRTKIELIQTSTLDELKRSLGDAGQKNRRFRIMMLIGHSNEHGLQLTSDAFMSWVDVGAWLNYFEPESVFLTACEAGRLPTVRDLFTAMPLLKRVYGSPTKLVANQNHPLVICALNEVGRRGLSADGRMAIQALNLLFTGGLMFRWTRGEVMKTGRKKLQSVAKDVAARLFEGFLSRNR